MAEFISFRIIKIVGIVLSLLILAIGVIAQDTTALGSDSMNNKLIRWSGITINLNLVDAEEVLYIDDSAIITGKNGRPLRLIATYAFNPNLLNVSLQLELNDITFLILSDFGSEPTSLKYYPIPEWVMKLNNINTLVLSNSELNNVAFWEDLSLTYLDLRKVHFGDKPSILKTFGNLKDLKILVHDESLSAEDLSIIKKSLPDVQFAPNVSKPKGK